MENRKRLAYSVLAEGTSLSEACRVAGVTRPVGRKWVARAREFGLESLAELSRAPKSSPKRTGADVEAALLAMKDAYPEWGARKLVVLLAREGISLASRTADDILKRNGRTCPAPKAAPPLQRFEKETCGAMLQMDFKGLPKSAPYALLSVLDDHGRFVLAFEPVPDKTGASVKAALWTLFGEHGLPESMLMDNGDCWGAVASKVPTAFEVWLMLLKVRPAHGKPGHPQTQGKVERFHGTAKLELGQRLVQPCIEAARQVLRPFVHRYNWVRPHDALNGAVPGSRYERFARERPDVLPVHEIPEGAVTRAVDAGGFFHFQGRTYKIGKGLAGQRIVLEEAELGLRTFFQSFPLPYLFEL